MNKDVEIERGEQARDTAVASVEDNANEGWKNAALRAICITASRKEKFITSDVWPNVDPEHKTHEARAMGPMMVRAKKNGWIEATDDFKLATMASRHRAPQRVWRSLLFPKLQTN